jgi:hypothetical protein
MNLYLRTYWESIKDVKPFPDMSDWMVLVEVILFVLASMSGVISIASVFLAGVPWWPFALGLVVLIGIGLHIETVARIKDKTHVCTEECR